MLSAEAEEKARRRWMDMFDKVYPKCESMFRADSTLVISRVDDLKTYGEDGLEYTLQVAPWEGDGEE